MWEGSHDGRHLGFGLFVASACCCAGSPAAVPAQRPAGRRGAAAAGPRSALKPCLFKVVHRLAFVSCECVSRLRFSLKGKEGEERPEGGDRGVRAPGTPPRHRSSGFLGEVPLPCQSRIKGRPRGWIARALCRYTREFRARCISPTTGLCSWSVGEDVRRTKQTQTSSIAEEYPDTQAQKRDELLATPAVHTRRSAPRRALSRCRPRNRLVWTSVRRRRFCECRPRKFGYWDERLHLFPRSVASKCDNCGPERNG